MSRILVLIAVVFALASIGGSAFAYAKAGGQGQAHVVELASGEICLEADAASNPVAYKPCGKKRNGIAVPCPHKLLVLPEAVACVAPQAAAAYEPPTMVLPVTGHFGERQFRPPRA